MIALLIVSVFVISFSGDITSVFGYDYEKAIYRGDETKNNVSVMINVYWGTEYIDSMLETLKEHDVKATFFIGGSWAAKNEDVLVKIATAGHEIGSHGYYHKDHAKLDFDGNYNEIYVTHKLIKQILGVDMDLFAMVILGYAVKDALVPSQVKATVENKVRWNKW